MLLWPIVLCHWSTGNREHKESRDCLNGGGRFLGAAEVETSLARDSLPVSHVTLSRKLKVRFQYLGIISHGGEGDGRGGGPWRTGCSVEFGQDGCAVILKLL